MSTFAAVDPSTREAFAEIPESSADDVDAAVQAARAAHRAPEWRTPARRAAALSAVARAIEAAGDDLADLECRDTGKPLGQARADVTATVRYFDFYAGAADKLLGTSIPLGPGYVDYTVREPWGVCGQIIPWNYPMQVLARCAAPALAAGNAVVLKPSELGSVTPLWIARLAGAAGLPEGLLNVVTGHGEVGQALVAHEGVDFITFVGSAAVGRLVAGACAQRLAPVQLELGGKSPNVVFADADLERAVPAIVKSLLQNAGQSCSAGSRLLVAAERRDEVVARVVGRDARADARPGPRGPRPGAAHLRRPARARRGHAVACRGRRGLDRPRRRAPGRSRGRVVSGADARLATWGRARRSSRRRCSGRSSA